MAKGSTAGGQQRPGTRAAATAEPEPPQRNRAADGRRGILVRAKPDAWRALKLIALDSDRTLQDVMTEAINDMLRKHKRRPIA